MPIASCYARKNGSYFNDFFLQRNTQYQMHCQESFFRFISGDTSLANKSVRRWPLDFKDQALLITVKEDESLTTRILIENYRRPE